MHLNSPSQNINEKKTITAKRKIQIRSRSSNSRPSAFAPSVIRFTFFARNAIENPASMTSRPRAMPAKILPVANQAPHKTEGLPRRLL
jgi:hypothetical protein